MRNSCCFSEPNKQLSSVWSGLVFSSRLVTEEKSQQLQTLVVLHAWQLALQMTEPSSKTTTCQKTLQDLTVKVFLHSLHSKLTILSYEENWCDRKIYNQYIYIVIKWEIGHTTLHRYINNTFNQYDRDNRHGNVADPIQNIDWSGLTTEKIHERFANFDY